MYTLKGFALIQPLADNTPNVISQLGELSNYSKTFSKDIGHYSRQEYPHIDLLSMRSVMTDGTSVTKVAIPSDISSKVLQITNWMYTEAVNGLFSNNSGLFTSAFLNQNGSLIDNFECGQMVTIDGVVFLPEWVSYKVVDVVDDNVVKIWFSDDSFRRQYDEYEIVVVPPIPNVDNLFQLPPIVKALIDQVDFTQRQELIELAKNNHPNTKTRVVSYTWSNPVEPNIRLTTPWGVIIYGPAGDNADAIKLAIGDYILSNSARDSDEWMEFIPDLFKSTEYVVIPMWDSYSIPNQTLVTGLHSPTIDISKFNSSIDLAKSIIDYPDAHIDQYLEYTVANYKSLGFFIVGSTENRDEIYNFKDRYGDYIVVPSMMTDFGRMSPETQAFVIELSRLLNVADRATLFSDIPLDMSKLIRDGRLFITKTIDDVLYVVLTRHTYDQIVSEPQP